MALQPKRQRLLFRTEPPMGRTNAMSRSLRLMPSEHLLCTSHVDISSIKSTREDSAGDARWEWRRVDNPVP